MPNETALQRRQRKVDAQSTERKNRAYKFIGQARAQREFYDSNTTLWTLVQTL
jgi:hypothetical protein